MHTYIASHAAVNYKTFVSTCFVGITQSTVDSADPFPVVHSRFLAWLEKHGLGTRHTFSIVTDGPFDMGRFLFLQIQHIGVEFPDYGKVWVNLRKAFSNFYKGKLKKFYPTNWGFYEFSSPLSYNRIYTIRRF